MPAAQCRPSIHNSRPLSPASPPAKRIFKPAESDLPARFLAWVLVTAAAAQRLCVWTLALVEKGWRTLVDVVSLCGAWVLGLSRWSAQSKTVVLTGASSGIGLSLARAYAAEGAKLYLVARRREVLEAVCEECLAAGATSATAVAADVSTETGWETIRSAIKEEEKVDLLVLNAGLSMGSPFASLSERNEAMGIMRHLMDVNYMGSVGVLDACLASMRRAEGGVRLLVVSSVVGLVAPPTRTGYAASKFALKGFCDALRIELAMSEPLPPTITLAYPGAVKTNINRARLRGGVDGAGGAVDLELDKSMSADECAAIMVRKHAAGQRDVMYSIDGTLVGEVKTHLLRLLAFFFPAGSDLVLAKSIGAMHKSRRQVKGMLRGVGRLAIASGRLGRRSRAWWRLVLTST